MHYFPIALPFLLLFAILFVFLILFIEVGVLRYAYERIGVGRRHMFALLILSFLGSYVNIPLFQLPPHKVASGELVTFFGMHYVVPVVTNWPGTIIAVNLGGAVIPTFLSIYLMVKNRLFRQGFLGVAFVTFFVHLMAYPVQGVGIAIPVFVPPLNCHCNSPLAFPTVCTTARIYGWKPGNFVRGRYSESRKNSGPWRPCRIDRRSRDFRRHFYDGNPLCSDGQPDDTEKKPYSMTLTIPLPSRATSRLSCSEWPRSILACIV